MAKKLTKENILNLLETAYALTLKYLSNSPDESRLKYVKSELERLRDLIGKQWPLKKSEKQNIHLGLFAVRELEGVEDDLADLLKLFHYQIENAGAS